MSTVHVELIVGKQVVDADGQSLGRLEEIVVEVENGELVVREFHTGAAGMLEHLSAVTIGAWLFKLLRRHRTGYRIFPEQIDVSGNAQIRVNVKRSELQQV